MRGYGNGKKADSLFYFSGFSMPGRNDHSDFYLAECLSAAAFTQMSAFCHILLEENPELETEVLSALQNDEDEMPGKAFSPVMDMRRRTSLRKWEKPDIRCCFPPD